MAALRAAGINERLMSSANMVGPASLCCFWQPLRGAVEDMSQTARTLIVASLASHPLLAVQDPDMQAALSSGDSTKEAQLLETWKAYKKGFQAGIALFNVKPKKGVAYLQVYLLFEIESKHVRCDKLLPSCIACATVWWESIRLLLQCCYTEVQS